MGKIKAIIKRPDEKVGHMTNVSNTLENWQRTVEGHIETLSGFEIVLILNEEGMIRGLPTNFKINGHNIYGTVAVVGRGEDDFIDCPLDMQTWKDLLTEWGNRI